MRLIEHDETPWPAKERAIICSKQKVFEHRVVCDQDVLWFTPENFPGDHLIVFRFSKDRSA
jgi:hypothetical protein